LRPAAIDAISEVDAAGSEVELVVRGGRLLKVHESLDDVLAWIEAAASAG
jgi:hypothetical protein